MTQKNSSTEKCRGIPKENEQQMTASQKAHLCRQRQPMSNEVEPNLTLFFRRFLSTPEEMDTHSGFRGTHWRAPGSDKRSWAAGKCTEFFSHPVPDRRFQENLRNRLRLVTTFLPARRKKIAGRLQRIHPIYPYK
jgi:hypothetical protein